MEHCDGCGFVWELVPAAEVAARVGESVAGFRRLLLPPDRPADWRDRIVTRPADGSWSSLEYACHVRDVLLAQRERLFLALVEDTPSFAPMYRDDRVTLARYAEEEPAEVVAQTEMAAHLFARSFAGLAREQLARTLQYGYPEPAVRTIAWLGAQTLHEMLHHADDIARRLAPHESGLDTVRRAPRDEGTVELLVRRPAIDEREVLDVAELDPAEGVVGDSWCRRPSSRTPDRSPHPDMQLNLMNSRAATLLAGSPDRWPLAGDQLFVDLDLSEAALPPGTRLALGSAIIEITAEPHRGCRKFSDRFGLDALRLVNSAAGRELRLRGANARVVTAGVVRTGDRITRVPD